MTIVRDNSKYEFDYDNQAWTKDGKYMDCNHPVSMDCKCYGKIHKGETFSGEPY
jgi:hypothetical protein